MTQLHIKLWLSPGLHNQGTLPDLDGCADTSADALRVAADLLTDTGYEIVEPEVLYQAPRPDVDLQPLRFTVASTTTMKFGLLVIEEYR